MNSKRIVLMLKMLSPFRLPLLLARTFAVRSLFFSLDCLQTTFFLRSCFLFYIQTDPYGLSFEIKWKLWPKWNERETDEMKRTKPKSESEKENERTNEIEKTMEIEKKGKGKMNESSYNCFRIFAHFVGFSPSCHILYSSIIIFFMRLHWYYCCFFLFCS